MIFLYFYLIHLKTNKKTSVKNCGPYDLCQSGVSSVDKYCLAGHAVLLPGQVLRPAILRVFRIEKRMQKSWNGGILAKNSVSIIAESPPDDRWQGFRDSESIFSVMGGVSASPEGKFSVKFRPPVLRP